MQLLKPPFLKVQSERLGGGETGGKELLIFTDKSCPQLIFLNKHLNKRDSSDSVTFRRVQAKDWMLLSHASRTNFPF